MKRALRLFAYTLAGLLAFILLVPFFPFGALKVIVTVMFGWIGFLRRVVPEITTNWSGIGMVLLCSLLIVAGIHWLAKWIYAHNKSDENRHWRWQWSFSLYAALWLLFAAAMGVTGFVHQLGWLVSSKESLFTRREYVGHTRSSMRQAVHEIRFTAEDADWNLDDTRKQFLTESLFQSYARRRSIEDFHIIFIPGKQGKLAAAIVFPRNADHRELTGFIMINAQTENWEEQHPMKDLPGVLARLGAN